MGSVLSPFYMYFDQLEDRDEVVSLIISQLENTLKGTRARAEKFVKKFGL